MTKLFSLVILYKGDTAAHILKVQFYMPFIFKVLFMSNILQAGHDLSSISYFQRGTAENFIVFTSKILVERTGVGARQSVKEAEYMCHVFVRSDKLSVVCVSDHEYPTRVAHTMMQRVSEDFAGQSLAYVNLKQTIREFQTLIIIGPPPHYVMTCLNVIMDLRIRNESI